MDSCLFVGLLVLELFFLRNKIYRNLKSLNYRDFKIFELKNFDKRKFED